MKLICSVCGNEFIIKLYEFTYINFDEPFICSSNCILTWIVECGMTKDSVPCVSSLSRKDIYFFNDYTDNIYGIRQLDNDGIDCFRSRYERSIALFLDANHIIFEYEKWGFIMDSCTYTPDFYLPYYDCFIEVKGSWGAGVKRKMSKFRARYKSVRLLIIPWVLRKNFINYKPEVIK